MSRNLAYPTLIGALLVGIAFNLILSSLGWLGVELWEALWLTLTSLTVSLWLALQVCIRSGRKAGD